MVQGRPGNIKPCKNKWKPTNSLEKLSGVSEVIINLDEKEVKLDYDENSIKLNKIIGEISALGFEIAEE